MGIGGGSLELVMVVGRMGGGLSGRGGGLSEVALGNGVLLLDGGTTGTSENICNR